MRKVFLIILSVFLFSYANANNALVESCRKILIANTAFVQSNYESIGNERMEFFKNEFRSVSNRDELVNFSNKYFSKEQSEIFIQNSETIFNELKSLSASGANNDDIKNAIAIVVEELPKFPCKNQRAYDDCMSGVNIKLGYNAFGAITTGVSAGGTWAMFTGEPYSTAAVGIGTALVGLWLAGEDYAKEQGDCYKTHCEGAGADGPGMPGGGIPKDNTPR